MSFSAPHPTDSAWPRYARHRRQSSAIDRCNECCLRRVSPGDDLPSGEYRLLSPSPSLSGPRREPKRVDQRSISPRGRAHDAVKPAIQRDHVEAVCLVRDLREHLSVSFADRPGGFSSNVGMPRFRHSAATGTIFIALTAQTRYRRKQCRASFDSQSNFAANAESIGDLVNSRMPATTRSQQARHLKMHEAPPGALGDVAAPPITATLKQFPPPVQYSQITQR